MKEEKINFRKINHCMYNMWMGEEIEWGSNINPYELLELLKKYLKSKDIRFFEEVKRGTYGLMLKNGGIIYKDRGVLETSTPECSSPLEILLYEKSYEKLINDLYRFCSTRGKINKKVMITKHNTLIKPNEPYHTHRGIHENFMVPKDTYKSIENNPADFFIFILARSLICGSGGYDIIGNFYISPRLYITSKVFGQGITHTPLPIIKSIGMLYEYMGNNEGFKRLQIVCGDGLVYELPIVLRFFLVEVFLNKKLENGFNKKLHLDEKLVGKLIKEVVNDTEECRWKVNIDGTEIDLPDYINSYLLEIVDKAYVSRNEKELASELKYISKKLCERNIESLRNHLEWVGRKMVIEKILPNYVEFDENQKYILSSLLSDFGSYYEDFTKKFIEGEFYVRPYRIIRRGLMNKLFRRNIDLLQFINIPPKNSKALARVFIVEKFYREMESFKGVRLGITWDRIEVAGRPLSGVIYFVFKNFEYSKDDLHEEWKRFKDFLESKRI